MGNCLVLQEKVIKVMKPDGKVLEYRSPIKVLEVLSEFSGHTLSETAAVNQHLRPETRLLGGRLYHLVPLPLQPQGAVKKKKKVRFSEPETEADQQQQEPISKVVRIKLVISKQELQELLKTGGVSAGDMVSKLHTKETKDGSDRFDHDDGDDQQVGCWKPALESIPEIN
ncbi:hypothetical protein PanWU01x14_281690 [Parasponia andersonii]|uniref:Uncharacterized protein n=1 Tax=Parasponia andersonii TaxID=3476 RepID=A0A2P5B0Y2_PARAD|nr:hypothetical protein PanWU01x14_281690 [Parasponia andersonii]